MDRDLCVLRILQTSVQCSVKGTESTAEGSASVIRVGKARSVMYRFPTARTRTAAEMENAFVDTVSARRDTREPTASNVSQLIVYLSALECSTVKIIDVYH